MATKRTLRTCKKGHQFYKSSDCPTCPICENERKPNNNFLASLGAPARRALERESIKTLYDLTKYSKKEILTLHGIGRSTIPKLQELLLKQGLTFRD